MTKLGLAPTSELAPRPATIVIAVIACALLCLLGVWIALNADAQVLFDGTWHDTVGVTQGSAGYSLAVALAVIGSSIGVGACVLLLSTWLLVTRRMREAVILVTTSLTGVCASELLKMLVARPRPVDALIDPPGFSYPSGHSMGAAMIATALALMLLARARSRARPRRATATVFLVAVCWVALMMWSRTALHVHWLSDTIAGALLGWSIAVLVRAAIVHATLQRTPRY